MPKDHQPPEATPCCKHCQNTVDFDVTTTTEEVPFTADTASVAQRRPTHVSVTCRVCGKIILEKEIHHA